MLKGLLWRLDRDPSVPLRLDCSPFSPALILSSPTTEQFYISRRNLRAIGLIHTSSNQPIPLLHTLEILERVNNMRIDSPYQHTNGDDGHIAMSQNTKFLFYMTPVICVVACAFFAILIVLLKRSCHVHQKADC